MCGYKLFPCGTGLELIRKKYVKLFLKLVIFALASMSNGYFNNICLSPYRDQVAYLQEIEKVAK